MRVFGLLSLCVWVSMSCAYPEDELADCAPPALATETHTTSVDTPFSVGLFLGGDVEGAAIVGAPPGVGLASDQNSLSGAAEQAGTFPITVTPRFQAQCLPPEPVPTFTLTLEVATRAVECNESTDCEVLYGPFASDEPCTSSVACGPADICVELLPGEPGTCQERAVCGGGTAEVGVTTVEGNVAPICILAGSTRQCTPRGLCRE